MSNLVRIATAEIEIAFGTGNEKRFCLLQDVESPKVEITAVHDVVGAGHGYKMIQDIDVVQFSIGNQDEFGNVALEIQQRVQFDRPFGAAKLRPGKQRKAQVDGGGVQGVDRGVEVETEVVAQIELFGSLDEDLSEVGVDAPVALVVGMSKMLWEIVL